MDLTKAIFVELRYRSGPPLKQFIEADTHDEAILKAKNTFVANLRRYAGRGEVVGKTTQRACRLSPLRGAWRFEFKSGWITRHACTDVFSELEAVQADPFLGGQEVEAIYQD
jgi:hypothetical protein